MIRVIDLVRKHLQKWGRESNIRELDLLSATVELGVAMESIPIAKSGYTNMDGWLPVGNIEMVTKKVAKTFTPFSFLHVVICPSLSTNANKAYTSTAVRTYLGCA